MKKAFVVLMLFFTIMLSACSATDDTQDTVLSTSSNCNTTINTQVNFTPEEIYDKFLSGKISVLDKSDVKKNINDFIGDYYNAYAIYDMNGDTTKELLLKTNYGLTIFWINNNNITVWREDTNYCKPLNNRAILSNRKGAAPKHIDYIYYILGFNGETLDKLEFSVYAKNELEGLEGEKLYFIEGSEVSAQTFYEQCNDILNIGDNNIIWHTIDKIP